MIKKPSRDPRVYWMALMFILAAVPVIYPLLLPVYVTDQTSGFYHAIEALPPGSTVAFTLTSGGPPIGLRTFYYALLKHMFSNDLNVIFLNFMPGGEVFGEYVTSYAGIDEEFDLKYGEDYVIMPFLAGEETAMAAAATDFQNAYSMDYQGIIISELPLVKDITDFDDIDLTIASYGVFTFGEMFVRQFAVNFKPICIIGQFYGIAPYWGTYVIGNIDGVVMAKAEYEYLVGIPGEEITRLDANNLQGVCVLLAVFGPLIMWLKGGRKTTEENVAQRF